MSEALGLPRNQIEKLIKNVGVEINGKKVCKSSFKVESGDVVSYEYVQADQGSQILSILMSPFYMKMSIFWLSINPFSHRSWGS